MARRFGSAGFASAMFPVLVFCMVHGGASSALPAAEQAAHPESSVEVSPAAAGLLHQVNTAPEGTLKGSMALPEGAVAKIMAHRKSGAKFTNLIELRKVSGITSADLERLLAPFEQAEAARAFESKRKPVPEPSAPAKAGGRLQRGETTPEKTEPAPAEPDKAAASGEGPITMIRPGFYGKLPGYDDLDKIDPIKRTEFLETVNRELCTCGCKNETIAFCLVNDPTCPVVKSRVKKIYDDIMRKPAN